VFTKSHCDVVDDVDDNDGEAEDEDADAAVDR